MCNESFIKNGENPLHIPYRFVCVLLGSGQVPLGSLENALTRGKIKKYFYKIRILVNFSFYMFQALHPVSQCNLVKCGFLS